MDDLLPPDQFDGTFRAHRYTSRAGLSAWLGEEYDGQLLEVAPRDKGENPDAPDLVFSLVNARHLGRLGATDDAVTIRPGSWVVIYDASDAGGGVVYMVSSRPFEWESGLQRPVLDLRHEYLTVPPEIHELISQLGRRIPPVTTPDGLIAVLRETATAAEEDRTIAERAVARLLATDDESIDFTGDQWHVIDKDGATKAGPFGFEGGLRYIAGFIDGNWESLTWPTSNRFDGPTDGATVPIYRESGDPTGMAIRWIA